MVNSERCWNWFDRHPRGAGTRRDRDRRRPDRGSDREVRYSTRRAFTSPACSSGAALAATLALRKQALFVVAIHSGLPPGAAFDAHDAGRAMAEGPRDQRTDTFALEARAAAGASARMPALIIQGSADTTVAPINADFLARQFVPATVSIRGRARPCRRP